MDAWLESGCALLLAIFASVLAFWLAKQRPAYWISNYVAALGVIIIFAIERNATGLEFTPPFSWVASGWRRYTLAAIIGPVLLLTPAAKLPGKRTRILLGVFAALFSLQFSVLPFLFPALARPTFNALATKIDPDGVCIQQTAYTCGPASAVTALRKLGLPAEEGQMAIWSHASQFGVTTEGLAQAIAEHYSGNGIKVKCRNFKSVAELKTDKGAPPAITLAVVKYSLLVDHFVAVLEVNDTEVILGDPLTGKVHYSYDDFARSWRFTGVTLTR